MIRAILHADKNWGIGKNNSLMFSIPVDMKFFRQTTSGKTVVMGGNTLRSFPNGKPLKNRTNIVLSRGQGSDECIFVHDLDALKAEMKKRENEDIYVIGGAQIYRALLPYCEEVLVTKVDAFGGADAFFPNLDEDKNFTLSSESEPLEDNGYTLRFVVYKNLDTQTL
jgi:dihydrofolate reductase